MNHDELIARLQSGWGTQATRSDLMKAAAALRELQARLDEAHITLSLMPPLNDVEDMERENIKLKALLAELAHCADPCDKCLARIDAILGEQPAPDSSPAKP